MFNLFHKMYKFLFVMVVSAFIFSATVHSELITQINIRQAGSVDRAYIKLLEKDAPLTVQNFRNYIRDGDYNNSFIHRSMPGFIVQGGGFTFDSTLNNGSFSYDAVNANFPGGLQLVPADLPVINEFKKSNFRGTLAMAKLGGDPDSATSQWFVNLGDNSANLDNQNGGFTVFAEVLGNGMDIFDTLANQPAYDRTDIYSSFANIPLLDFSFNSATDPVANANLVFVDSISEVLSITSDIDYGTVSINSNLQPEVVIQNIGETLITIGAIGGVDSLAAPFNRVVDLCSYKVLQPGQRCSLIALFAPESAGVYEDSFDVEFPGLGINYLLKLSGEGIDNGAEADITSSFSSIDFSKLDVLYGQGTPPYFKRVLINNFGTLPLDLYNLTLSAASDSEFSLAGNCLIVTTLATNESCYIELLYSPLSEGSQTATIIIESNDPDESLFEIPVFAVSLGESDGVNAAVENAAPNNGDGNNDGVQDSQQSYIASLPDIGGTYLTYISDVSQQFTDVRIVDQGVFTENKNGAVLSAGVHEFVVDNVASDGIVKIGLLMPAGVNLSSYYIFGPTLENPTPHWYTFDFNGETGASFLGVAKFPSPTGGVIERNVVLLTLKNGGRGDSTVAQDNKLIVRGGVSYSYNDTSSGFLSLYFLQIFFVLFLFRKGLN